MSFKQYEAWRIPLEKLQDFIVKMDKKIMKRITGEVDSWMNSDGVVKRAKEYINEKLKQHNVNEKLKQYKRDEYTIKKVDILYWIWMQAIDEKNREVYEIYDLNCSWAIRLDGEYAYLTFHGPPWVLSNYNIEKRGRISFPSYTEEYGYWDNTDEPDDVSEEEWKERKKIWMKFDKAESDGNKHYRLFHEVMRVGESLSGLGGFGKLFYAMEKRYGGFGDAWTVHLPDSVWGITKDRIAELKEKRKTA